MCLCLSLAWPGAQAKAQDPTPDTGAIFDEGAQVYFPLALDLRVQVASQYEFITGATLVMEQASGFRADYTLKLPGPGGLKQDEAYDLAGFGIDTSELQKFIVFSEPLPRPFEPINYRWQVQIQDEEAPSELAGQVIFAPAGVEWQDQGEDPLRYYWYNPRLGLPILSEELNRAYQLLNSHTGQKPDLRLVIFEPDYVFCQSLADPESGEERQVIPGQPELDCSFEFWRDYLAENGYTLIWTPINEFEARQNALGDALVAAFYADYWAGEAVPLWFQAGLTQLYRPAGNLRALAFARNASAIGQSLSLAQLERPAEPEQSDLWAAQSYLMTLYLADQYGAGAPFEVAKNIPGAGFEAALAAFGGLTPATLYRATAAWISNNAADVAAAWNPYLAATPTPTQTPSQTPIPPSRTPSLTPTFTLTPTSTSLVGRNPTQVILESPTGLIPTLTPSPSNTPLPPGSLQRPTLVPTPAPASEEGGRNLPCGAGAVIMPAMGLVLALQHKSAYKRARP